MVIAVRQGDAARRCVDARQKDLSLWQGVVLRCHGEIGSPRRRSSYPPAIGLCLAAKAPKVILSVNKWTARPFVDTLRPLNMR
jgi:hypothetical protein